MTLALSEQHVLRRADELERLREMAELAADRGGLVVLSGEPGIGKTRLAAELAYEVSLARGLVLYGRCDSAPAAPYQLFVDALEHPVASRATRKLMDNGRHPPPLARDRNSPLSNEDEELARLQMFDAVHAVLQTVSARRRTLVVLEDLHWAPPSTLALLKHLVTRSPRSRLTFLGTLRIPDPDRGDAIQAAITDLRRAGKLHEVAVQPLTSEHVSALISDWTGLVPEPRLVADLHAYTGGNPFYLRSTLRHLTRGGLLVGPAGALRDRLRDEHGGLPIPDDVRDLAGALVQRLGPSAAALLQTGAVLGSEFALDEAASAAGLDPDQTVAALDVATEAGLVRQRSGSPIRVSFEHALIQQALREAMTPARRALVSLRAAEAIESAGAPAARSAELAARFADAMTLGTASRTFHWAILAADEARRRYAFEEQAENLELALLAIQAGGATLWDEYDVQMELGRARYRAAQLDRSNAAFGRAADIAEEGEDPVRLAQAALGVGLERYLHRAGMADAQSIALLERGLRAIDGRHSLAARLSTALALERRFLDPLEEHRQRIDSAIAIARALRDTDAEIEARTVRQVALWFPTYTSELLAEVPALVTLARKRGRRDLEMHLHSTGLGQALELGRREALEEHLAGAIRVARDLRSPIQQVRAEALRILVALVDGQLEQATAAIEAVVPVMEEIEPETARYLGMLWQLMLARQRGSLAEVRPQLEALVSAAPELPLARAFLAEAQAEGGDLAAARQQLELLAAGNFEDVGEDFVWLAVLSAAGRVAARVADLERVRTLYRKLVPYADRFCLSGVATAGPPVAYSLGLMSAALGNREDAANYLAAAIERARSFGARPWQAHAAHALGGVLRRAGSRRAAREPLSTALRLAESYGAEPLAARSRDELLAVGGRPRRRREEPGLTRSELRVARLAAQGQTNDQIAQALYVSRRTVETHLTHAYRKLGIGSRGELVAALEEQEQVE